MRSKRDTWGPTIGDLLAAVPFAAQNLAIVTEGEAVRVGVCSPLGACWDLPKMSGPPVRLLA